ncbi:MAG: TM0106 family RecB-like putative nuclease [Microcystaceae cyanobacterium]
MLLTDFLLLDYKRCQRRAYLSLYGNRADRAGDRDFLLKLREESQRHIQAVLQNYYPDYVEPQTPKSQWYERSLETEALMAAGVNYIFNGFLSYSRDRTADDSNSLIFVSHPHLLVRQEGESRWGNWSYSPISIQLGRRPKPEYKIIAAFHAELLILVQFNLPSYAEIILRRRNHYRVDLAEWRPRLAETLQDCIKTLKPEAEPEVFISRQRCSLCSWHGHCYQIAQAQQHLSLVPGVTPSRYESLQSLGINTIQSLAATALITIEEHFGRAIALQLHHQALALVENRPFLRHTNYPKHLPQGAIELYFDIEAEPEQNLDYLLGLVVIDRLANTEKFYGFFADNLDDEAQIWQDFLTFVNQYPDAPIFHFSDYEVETIKRLAQLYNTPKRERDLLIKRCFDLHHFVVNTVILPVESYSLKSLANWIGFQWRDANASGDQSVCWYDQWLQTGDRSYQELILRYNEDDCRATWILKDWLVNFFKLSP